MKPIGRPVGRTSEQTRAVILAAAAEEFGERGYTRASIRRIAERANLTSAALYHHFPTKLACLDAVLGEALDILRSHWDPILAGDGHIADRVALLLKAGAVINREHPHMARIGARSIMEDAAGHPEMSSVTEPLRTYADGVYDKLVADAVARGELAEGVPAQAVRDMISGLMIGLANVAALQLTVERHAAVIDALAGLLAGRLFTAMDGAPAAAGAPTP